MLSRRDEAKDSAPSSQSLHDAAKVPWPVLNLRRLDMQELAPWLCATSRNSKGELVNPPQAQAKALHAVWQAPDNFGLMVAASPSSPALAQQLALAFVVRTITQTGDPAAARWVTVPSMMSFSTHESLLGEDSSLVSRPRLLVASVLDIDACATKTDLFRDIVDHPHRYGSLIIVGAGHDPVTLALFKLRREPNLIAYLNPC